MSGANSACHGPEKMQKTVESCPLVLNPDRIWILKSHASRRMTRLYAFGARNRSLCGHINYGLQGTVLLV